MEEERIKIIGPFEIELQPIDTHGFILDIGGGGAGIIGKLNGRQVIAIDIREEELLEAKNEALKIVMDARKLQFLPESFDVCTAFFTFMYIKNEDHRTVFKEIYRVLKRDSRFLLWDVVIPERKEDYDIFAVHLRMRFKDKTLEEGYGVKWDKTQDMNHFKKLAKETGFDVIKEWQRDEIFHLEMIKKDKGGKNGIAGADTS